MSETNLHELHEALAAELFRRVKSKESSSTDLSVARQFLKDNGIEQPNPPKGSALASLAESLPFDDPDTCH